MNYIFDLEDRIRRKFIILTSMGFDTNQIGSIASDSISDVVTFHYTGDTIWQVDLEERKQRCLNNDEWSDWVYM